MDLDESRYSFNGVKPSNKSEAVMWNRYNDTLTDFEWDWIKIRFWPKNLAEAVIRKSLNYNTRWQLLLYFVGNGMDPLLARDAVIEAGDGYFDGSAKEHVRNLYKDLRKNASRWKYWDEHLGRTAVLEETLVAKDLTQSGYKFNNNNIKNSATYVINNKRYFPDLPEEDPAETERWFRKMWNGAPPGLRRRWIWGGEEEGDLFRPVPKIIYDIIEDLEKDWGTSEEDIESLMDFVTNLTV